MALTCGRSFMFVSFCDLFLLNVHAHAHTKSKYLTYYIQLNFEWMRTYISWKHKYNMFAYCMSQSIWTVGSAPNILRQVHDSEISTLTASTENLIIIRAISAIQMF